MDTHRPGNFRSWVQVVIGLGFAASLGADCLPPFQRGDSNRDNKVDLGDPIFTLGYLFLGSGKPGCLDAADTDDNEELDLSDAVYALRYLFLGGTPMPPPLPGSCGIDPTLDALDCRQYSPCEVAGAQPCTSNDCCDLGSYCEKEVDDCDGVGACVVRPVICPRFFDPWCGCDGVTYGNRCGAAAAGVNVVHRGECARPGGCQNNDGCNLGSYCATSEGACDELGECQPRPDGCPKNIDPVCGCDDVTYSNDCVAASSGVSVAYRGECKRGTRCTSNEQCDPGEYCMKDLGDCDAVGICERRPDLCAQFFDPMCGCDGVTYGNTCLAGVAGVNIARKGPCDAEAQCRTNEECADDSYCARPEGFCEDPGFCLKDPDPQSCKDQPFDPVCGCDKITYDNSCLAALQGVTVLRRGPCELGAPCSSNADCREETFCFKKESRCDDPGICSIDPKPEECQGIPDEAVCGCDNQTYRSFCEANLRNVNVAYIGPCDNLPRCRSDKDCPEDSYCEFRVGSCGGLDLCAVRPLECPPDIVEPVCGCDNRTYLNDCLAAMAGMAISFRGKCEGGNSDCQTSASCGGGHYCAKSTGDCDGTGSCENLPAGCDNVFNPVCGCDGITYSNECHAHAAGVNVLQAGECP